LVPASVEAAAFMHLDNAELPRREEFKGKWVNAYLWRGAHPDSQGEIA
jgi:hypothetical protein